MKFRHNLISLIGIVLLIFCVSCSNTGFAEKLPDQLPFLFLQNGKNTELLWNKASLDLNDGRIIETDRPVLVQNQLASEFKLTWDGAHTFFSYSPQNRVQLLPLDEKDSHLLLQAPDSSPYYVFNASKPDQQVLVYLPTQASQRDEAIVEIFGKKAQKLTLRMPSIDFPGLRILRPLAIASTIEGWSFYFQTIESKAEKISLGIIAAAYDYSETEWSMVSRIVPFNEASLTSQMCYYKNKLYLSSMEGEILTIHPKNGKMHKHELLSKEIKAFKEQILNSQEDIQNPGIYSYAGYLIVHLHANDESIYVLSDGNKVKAILKTLQGKVVLLSNSKLLPIELSDAVPLPTHWIFPES
jgi:hypothetical protein